jgi:hypothetical protein
MREGAVAHRDYAWLDRAQKTTADNVDNHTAIGMIAVGETR